MTPFSFEWQWNLDYIIFMGFLYMALTIVAAGLIYAGVKTWMAVADSQEELPPEIPSRTRYSEY